MPDDISIVTPIDQEPHRPGMRWQPEPGQEVAGLLAFKLEGKASAQAKVLEAARSILGRSVPRGEAGSDTGLVVGYVQSGKTLSFTAVMALARDNGFQLVIVVAGSSTQLADQSHGRIQKDLRVSTERARTWAVFHNPREAQSGVIGRMLDEWRDKAVPHDARQTIAITVMKNHRNLGHLIKVLKKLDLSGVSALLVDDEADQASLNNEVSQGSESATYRKLLEVRSLLSSHTFLQYTATPQAPLLISIIDTLSPNFVEVLEPGEGYTGGRTFFGEPNELVRVIPAAEVPTASNQLTGVPPTLREALRLFMVGVAAGLIQGGAKGNRSMLVHPSHRTAQHQEYLTWIRDLFEDWRATLMRGDDEARDLADSFQSSYESLARTVGAAIPAFDDIKARLRSAFNNTGILEVNRRQGGAPVLVDWRQHYGWILVGGQAMDRGFTVEGLTVTYMPRGIGTGNADTVQQRARFFGYKNDYLGYCRVFLERQTKAAFEAYVAHEEFMRAELAAFQETGKSLDEWRRVFLLDPRLKPCRDSVLEFDYVRSAAPTDGWFVPEVFLGGSGLEGFNREAVRTFMKSVPFSPAPGHPDRTDTQRHRVSEPLPLRRVVEELLVRFKVKDPDESQRWTITLLQLSRALDAQPEAACVVYEMSEGRPRERGVDKDTGKIKNLFQGANPQFPIEQRGAIYPGDREIKAPELVTVQVHNLTLTQDAGPDIPEVPVIAVHIPREMAIPLIVQNQPAQPGTGA